MGCTGSKGGPNNGGTAPGKDPSSSPGFLPSDKMEHWTLFMALDSVEEAQMQDMSTFLKELYQVVPKVEEIKAIASELSDPDRSGLIQSTHSLSLNDVSVDEDLADPMSMAFPFQQDEVEKLFTYFEGGGHLSRKHVSNILAAGTELLKSQRNISYIKLGKEDNCVVVGDLHGQLFDLICLLRKNGLPGEGNYYVFNGDFVDRGPSGCEVVCLILSLMVLAPDYVKLNRGNHEDRHLASVYSFQAECIKKYDIKTFDRFCTFFDWIPLCCLVRLKDEKTQEVTSAEGDYKYKNILILHGGLFNRLVKLKEIDSIERSAYTNFDNKIKKDIMKISDEELTSIENYKMMRELLWSDPMKENGSKANTSRRVGTFFGPDVCHEFLRENKLDLLIRSHECIPNGVDWPYGEGKYCATVFSASNYSKSNNMGAVLKIPGHGALETIQYTTKEMDEKLTTEERNFHSLQNIVMRHKAELKEEFAKNSTEASDGTHITLDNWCLIMNKVTKVEVDWRLLSNKVLNESCFKGDGYCWNSFLNQYKIDYEGDNVDIERRDTELFDSIYTHRPVLEALFRYFDKDGDGAITREEFTKGCKMLAKKANSPALADPGRVYNVMDMDENGMVSMNEFMECFRLTGNNSL